VIAAGERLRRRMTIGSEGHAACGFLLRAGQELWGCRFFIYSRYNSKTFRNSGGSVFIRNILLLFIHTLACTSAPAATSPASAPAPGARRSHPYSLYLVPHSLCHNAIDNAAAGVANPARVNYIDNAIAAAGDANARGVSNANSRGVCVCTCAGRVMLTTPWGR
jgi:hypothetical protein